MKFLLAIIANLIAIQSVLADQGQSEDSEIILPVSPPQKVFSRYQRDFGFHNDRGFYFSAAIGPQ